MNKSEIKLILDFMGYERRTYFPKVEYLIPGLHRIEGAVIWVDELDLRFHNSWDYLMPVVEKIENFHIIGDKELEFQVVNYEDEVKVVAKHFDKPWEVIVEVLADGNGKLANTYKAVVEFINWYNTQDND